MPLDTTCTDPMYLVGRLAALGDKDDHRLTEGELGMALGQPLRALPMLIERIAKAKRGGLAEEIMDLIPGGNLPAGPVPVEQQGSYWTGYYHQRDYPRHVAITREQLEAAGKALAGDRWQTDLADRRGWDSARVRQILSGARPMPGGAFAEIVAALRHRSIEANQLADEMEQMIRDSMAGDVTS